MDSNRSSPSVFPNRIALRTEAATSEATLVQRALHIAALDDAARKRIYDDALRYATAARHAMRSDPLPVRAQHLFGLDSPIGMALMQIVEALPRTPDAASVRLLLVEKLNSFSWQTALSNAAGLPAKSMVGALAIGALVCKLADRSRPLALLGLHEIVRIAFKRTTDALSDHYILGESIAEALHNTERLAAAGYLFSFDMLGEAALTHAQAKRFHGQYLEATRALENAHACERNAISVKLSALHPRFEERQRRTALDLIVERAAEIAVRAKHAGLQLTIDAEEAERLELTLDVFERLRKLPELDDWHGLGIAVQAYQRRALAALEWLRSVAQSSKHSLNIRLVKGAYWDAEIKRAQQLGLDDYPVFTRKAHSDVNYLACARVLLKHRAAFYPQFATHNAQTIASVLEIARQENAREFEFQRLQGMGDHLHDALLKDGHASRIYAPIGPRHELLPYLVRRLIENGASGSFVHRLSNAGRPIADSLRDPIDLCQAPHHGQHSVIAAPTQIARQTWPSAQGRDVCRRDDAAELLSAVQATDSPYEAAPLVAGSILRGDPRSLYNPARTTEKIGVCADATDADIASAVRCASNAVASWSTTTPQQRAQCLQQAARLFEERLPRFARLAVLEAGKTLDDAVAEVREAVDFFRYYAEQCLAHPHRRPLGVVACISPWNFPLAIYSGQIAGALAVGNVVIAKPAEQTPLIAMLATQTLHEAGIPATALQLLPGDGAVGAKLVAQPAVAAVCFTGSIEAAQAIALTLASTQRGAAPLIAETGGVNAMIVDSTALPEQAVRDIAYSAFQSAGQRCSALRILCVQEDIAEQTLTLLRGYMHTLRIGDPRELDAEVGPLIDAAALKSVSDYVDQHRASVIAQAAMDATLPTQGYFYPPTLLRIARIADVTREIFGPVLHVLTFKAAQLEQVMGEIDSLGYGLTLGLHTRLTARAARIAAKARIGNVYINRHQVGAVVGQQPFGGTGLSGAGPKAGGPWYLLRLSQDTPSAASLDAQDALLPAIAGEENRWRCRPRGTLLCLGDLASSTEAALRQIRRAVDTGNAALVAFADLQAQTQLQTALLREPQLATSVRLIAAPSTILTEWLDALPIDGVLFDGDAPTRHDLALALARRRGALIPLLTSADEPYRFYFEQAVCANTAAVGGDASLIEMATAQ